MKVRRLTLPVWASNGGAALIGMSVLFIALWLPSPYDESLYRNFAKAIAVNGIPYLPELPDGYFLRFHPYLVVFLNSLWIRLGFESVFSLRLFQFFLWFVPSLWLMHRLASTLFSRDTSKWTFVLLTPFLFFHLEAATSEMDIPYTFMMLWVVWLTWKWHQSLSSQSVFNRAWAWLTLALVLAAWVKFQCALTGVVSFLLTLWTLGRNSHLPRRKALLAISLSGILMLFSFFGWLLLAKSMGIDIFHALLYVTRGLAGQVEAYRSEVSSYSWLHYLLFSARYLGPPTFILALLAIWSPRNSKNRQSLMYVILPIFVVGISLLLSRIREIRYWDAAIPFLAILGATLAPRNQSSMNQKPSLAWASVAGGIFVALFLATTQGLLPGLPPSLHRWLGLLATFLGTAMMILPQLPTMRKQGFGLLVASILSFNLNEYADHWHIRNASENELGMLETSVASLCQPSERFGLYRMRLAYGLSCPFRSTELAKSFTPAEYEDITLWILPLDTQLLREPFREDTFLRWLHENYLPMPLQDKFRYHQIWRRRTRSDS